MTHKIIFKEESYKIVGAFFEIYKEKGNGFLEAVYQQCLKLEFQNQGIPFLEKPALDLFYKGVKLEKSYEPDFVCYGKIIVELKAVKNLANEHRAQVINYLKATNMRLGLLANFGHYPKLEYERLLN
ncbi:GxxExxY protein [Desulfococcaceae bacterium HSG9]|nr:GxxExxY protein [Desulfococcaceae bacterium HSG9]